MKKHVISLFVLGICSVQAQEAQQTTLRSMFCPEGSINCDIPENIKENISPLKGIKYTSKTGKNSPNKDTTLFMDTPHQLETFYFQSGDVSIPNANGFRDLILCGGRDFSGGGIGPSHTFCQLYSDTNNELVPVDEFEVEPLHLGAAKFIDFNNDGLQDIVITGLSYNNISTYNTYIYLNQGEDKYKQVSDTPGLIFSEISVADFNNDGLQDFMVNGRGGSTYTAETYLYSNKGDGTFKETVMDITSTQMTGNAKLMDINNDHQLDLIVNGPDKNYVPVLKVYKNTNGKLVESQSFQGTNGGGIHYADFNADGHLDFVVNGQEKDALGVFSKVLKVYWNDGKGNFTPEVLALGSNNANGHQSIDVGDLNNDGYYDFMVFGDNQNGKEQSVMYLYNPATKTFDPTIDDLGIIPIGGTSNVQLIDTNHDNHLDVIVSGYTNFYGGYTPVTKLYINQNKTKNKAPLPPTNLQLNKVGNRYNFVWSGATDDTTPEKALRYELTVGSGPGKADLAKYEVTTPSWVLINEEFPETIYWSVKSIDASKVYSEASKEVKLGVKDSSINMQSVNLYPNPAKDKVTITGAKVDSIELYNLNGQRYNVKLANDQSINTAHLPKGVYLLQMIINQQTTTQKLIIQ